MGRKLRRLRQTEPDTDSNSSDRAGSDYAEQADQVLYAGAVNLPAHRTKHLARLQYTFPSVNTTFEIAQNNDSHDTGSSLWLSSQILSSYLLHKYSQPVHKDGTPSKAIEIGSGTGLLSLLLAKCGWNVLATDLASIIESTLKSNVRAGMSQVNIAGQVHVHELDWQIGPEQWKWNTVGPYTSSDGSAKDNATLSDVPDFDLIVSSDTIYETSLIRPLLRTISFLYTQYVGQRKCTVLLALERRDASHVDTALRMAQSEYQLPFRRVSPQQVRKIFDAVGDGKSWSRQDWDGVEIWKV